MKNYKSFAYKLIGLDTPTIYQMIMRKIEIFYESLYGIDFLTVIPTNKLGLDKNMVSKGSPSGNKFLYNLLKDLNITQNDSILDIGCAKGSALKYMSKFPFNKVNGLELSKTLVQVCSKNFTILNNNKIKIYNQSAIDFNDYDKYNFFI